MKLKKLMKYCSWQQRETASRNITKTETVLVAAKRSCHSQIQRTDTSSEPRNYYSNPSGSVGTRYRNPTQKLVGLLKLSSCKTQSL